MGYSPPKAPGNPYASIGGATMEPGGGFAPPQPAGVSTMQSGAGNPTAPGILPNWLHRMRGGKVSRTRMMMQHRAGGGGVLPSGTALVHYKRPGISVGGSKPVTQEGDMVTGGTGAAPALPGRIGYRGRLTSGTPPVDGINAEKQYQNQKALNAGARKEIDPVTGLSQNPTQNEINAQIQMLAGKGDPAGLEGQGVGGSKQAQSVAAYYQAKQNGNPDAIAQATQGVQNLKRTINGVGQPQQQPQSPAGAPIQDAGVKPNAFPDAPPLNDPNTLDTPGLKTGGKEQPVHPYDVNEEGTESVKYKGEKPQLIPGGEHVVTFPKSGRVIPHGRTMQMMSKGMIQPTEADPTSPASPVSSGPNPPMGQPTEYDPNPPASAKHRLKGGPEQKTRRFAHIQVPPEKTFDHLSQSPNDERTVPMNFSNSNESPPFKPSNPESGAVDEPENPVSSILGKVFDYTNPYFYANKLGNNVAPFVHPIESAPPTPGLKSYASAHSPAEAAMVHRQNHLPQESMDDAMYAGAPAVPEQEETVPEGDGEEWSEDVPTRDFYDTPSPQSAAVSQAVEGIMGEHGVIPLNRTDNSASFVTPYGEASVTHGAPTAGPHVFDNGKPWMPHRMRGGKVSRTRMMMRHTDGR